MSMPASALNSSLPSWLPEPTPPEPKLSLFGCAFASAINSFRPLAGTDGCTTMTFGTVASREIGAKSRKVSYPRFLNRLGLIATVGLVSNSV
jgi:hypothetical protein